jgi:hypothetical protein
MESKNPASQVPTARYGLQESNRAIFLSLSVAQRCSDVGNCIAISCTKYGVVSAVSTSA